MFTSSKSNENVEIVTGMSILFVLSYSKNNDTVVLNEYNKDNLKQNISTRGIVYYYCWEKDPTNMHETALILLISQQLHNFFQNPLAHIFYSYKQTLGWSFYWIL